MNPIDSHPAALLLALGAAVCFGGALVVTQFGLRHTTPLWGAAISIIATVVFWWPISGVFIDWAETRPDALILFALVGLFYPALVMMLTYESNRILGPTLTGTASSTTPVFAVVSSVLLLGERPSVTVVLGCMIVVMGLATLSMKAPMRLPSRWHVMLPLAAAMLRGIAQSLLKLGLIAHPSPFTAALVSYTVSAAVVWSAAAGRSAPGARRLTKKSVMWFVCVAALNGTAVMMMCYALQYGSVAIVSPVIATYPLFTIVFSATLLQREELTWKTITGAMLTVAGVAIISGG